MKPIGLNFKNLRQNPYTGRINGELMIVHQCLVCGKISSNRIAGDDDPIRVASLLEKTNKLGKKTTKKLTSLGIKLLTQKDKPEVLTTLYGYDYHKFRRKETRI
jgi:hypothetical protein